MRLLILSTLAVSTLLAANRVELDVSASQVWTDTGINLQPGDRVTISASGTIQLDYTHVCKPDGLPRSWSDLTTQYPLTNSGKGALIGRFSDNPVARPFLVGPWVQRNAPIEGRLFLGVNETDSHAGAGSFHVTVEWNHSAASPRKCNRLPSSLYPADARQHPAPRN